MASPSSSPALSVREFFARFPDDDACLAHIMKVRYGGTTMVCEACGVEGEFHKLRDRRVFACPHCLFQIAPTANTILHDTRTPLVSWFYAMYLFSTTRHGVSGKELQRQLGVTYKTAYRIGMQIRKLIEKADEFTAMQGHVEADETYIGGRTPGKRGPLGKTVVAGVLERGGRTHAQVVANSKMPTLKKVILENVAPRTIVSTDEHSSYGLLTKYDYNHGTVSHSKKEYAKTTPDGVKHHTNTIESFWGLFKRSIASTHIKVSAKHMDLYLNEFTFRSNHRQMQNAMFDLMVGAL